MKYLLTFVRDEDQMYGGSDEDMKAGMEAWNQFNREAMDAGVMIADEALELPNTAKTVRVTDGEPVITDGPFAETKEQLGGFALIDVADLDEAIAWAKKVPMRPDSLVEVRAVKDLTPYGYQTVSLSSELG
ncbi:MAG TPA: YciI family protein [Solirubrobacterales bacterium]